MDAGEAIRNSERAHRQEQAQTEAPASGEWRKAGPGFQSERASPALRVSASACRIRRANPETKSLEHAPLDALPQPPCLATILQPSGPLSSLGQRTVCRASPQLSSTA